MQPAVRATQMRQGSNNTHREKESDRATGVMEWKGWLEIEFLASCHPAVGGQLGPLKHLLHFLTSQSSESKNSTKHTKLCMDKQSQTARQTDRETVTDTCEK